MQLLNYNLAVNKNHLIYQKVEKSDTKAPISANSSTEHTLRALISAYFSYPGESNKLRKQLSIYLNQHEPPGNNSMFVHKGNHFNIGAERVMLYKAQIRPSLEYCSHI
nr:unnamed protein product [Callosobruchus chinensis]